MQVTRRKDESIDKMIRRFTKKIKRCGILEDHRDSRYYEKPSVARRIKSEKAEQARQREKRKKERNRKRRQK
jgi:small subunit ribosomal protein S21